MRRFLASLLAFGVPWVFAWAWLNAPAFTGAWRKVDRLVNESRRSRPACDAFAQELRVAGAEVADHGSALKLLSVLERHPGSDRAGHAAQGLIAREASLGSGRVPERLADELIRMEPFCALPDFYESWRKLVSGSDRLKLSSLERQRLVELGLRFVRSESAAPARASSVFFQVATLQSLSEKGWLRLPGPELRRLTQLTGRLREDLKGQDRVPARSTDSTTLQSIRLELEKTRRIREEVSGMVGRLPEGIRSSPGA